jgi:hypothetical protein
VLLLVGFDDIFEGLVMLEDAADFEIREGEEAVPPVDSSEKENVILEHVLSGHCRPFPLPGSEEEESIGEEDSLRSVFLVPQADVSLDDLFLLLLVDQIFIELPDE